MNIESITSTVARGEGNLGRLVQDDTLYERVDRVTRNVEEFVDSALGSEVQVGFRSEYLALQQSTKNHADVRLVYPRKDKYYSLGVVGTSLENTDDAELKLNRPDGQDAGGMLLSGAA